VVTDGLHLLASQRSHSVSTDATERESFHNHVHVEDVLERDGPDLLAQALLYARTLAESLQERFPGVAFRIVLHTHMDDAKPGWLGWVVRFQRVRPEQPPWPGRPVGEFEEPMLGTTVGPGS
jgi:hypothetical protein